MLPASGGPRSSTARRGSGCRLSRSAFSGERFVTRRGRLRRGARSLEPRQGQLYGRTGGVSGFVAMPLPECRPPIRGFDGLGRQDRVRGARARGGRPALLRRLHVDAAAEATAVLEPDARRREVAEHGRRPADQDLLAREEVATHLAGDTHDLRVNVGVDLARLADGDVVPRQVDLALDLAQDREVLVAGDVADDRDRRADAGRRVTTDSDGARRRMAGGAAGVRGRTDSSSRLFHMAPLRDSLPSESLHGRPPLVRADVRCLTSATSFRPTCRRRDEPRRVFESDPAG